MLFTSHSCKKYSSADNKFKSHSKIPNPFSRFLSVCVPYFDGICSDIYQLMVPVPKWNIVKITFKDFYRYLMKNTVYLVLANISENSASI